MLHVDPDQPIMPQEALHHPFFILKEEESNGLNETSQEPCLKNILDIQLTKIVGLLSILVLRDLSLQLKTSSRKVFFHLKNIVKIRKVLPQHDAEKLFSICLVQPT